MEANEEKRNKYIESIKNITAQHLVYIDESGIEMTICKDRGWGKKGKLLHSKKSGKYYERTNIIAGYINNKIFFTNINSNKIIVQCHKVPRDIYLRCTRVCS